MNITRVFNLKEIPEGYTPIWLDDRTPNPDLRPGNYKVIDTEIDRDFIEERQKQYADFRNLGDELTKLKGLELEVEPGSGKPVPAGNYSIRRPGGGFFITGTGVNKNSPTEEGILLIREVDYGSGAIRKTGTAMPSRETVHVVELLQIEPYVRLRAHGQFAMGKSVDEVIDVNKKHHTRTNINKIQAGTIILINTTLIVGALGGILIAITQKTYEAIQNLLR